jgi:hypothetical protein
MRHSIGSELAALVDFLTIHHDRRRCFNADADAIAFHRHHGDANVAIDHNFFARTTGQN